MTIPPFSSTSSNTDNTPAAPASLKTIALGTVLVLLVLLSFWLFVTLRTVLITLFLGILVATSLRVVVDWLRRFNLPRALAAGITILLLLALVVVFVVALAPTAFTQAQALVQELPVFYGNLRTVLIESPYRIVRQFGSGLSPTLATSNGSYFSELLLQTLTWLPGVGYGLFITLNALLLTYYWLLYRERSVRGLLLLLPITYRAEAEDLWLQIEAKLGAFLRSQVLLMGAVGLASLVGYWLVGVPYALLLALVAGLLELVPFIGPIVSTVLAVAVGMSISPALGFGALAVGLVVQQLENNILAPRIVDRVLGISPVVTLLALVGFTALFGFIGTLLAIPLAAMLQVLFERWLARSTAAPGDEHIEGRSMAARLRYEVQDLAQDVRSHVRRKEDEVDRKADEAEEELEKILLELDVLLKQNDQREL